jgi:RNA polymerase sigma-70 factor, ECF subfamily
MLKSVLDCSLEVPLVLGPDVCPSEQVSAATEEVLQLFLRYRNPLLRYTVSFGLSRHDSEEVVQEVFLALFRHLHACKPRTNLAGWIFRVAHNQALKSRAAKKKSQIVFDPNPADSFEWASLDPDPEQRAVDHQLWQRMQAVLRALPEQDRCCLCLRAEGLRYREIAATLGISLGAVSLALTHSLQRIKTVSEG